jgi:hypothetical protein
MSDNSLSVPKKVEYIVLKSPRPKRMLILIRVIVAVVTVVAIAVFLREKNLTRTYPDSPLQALGLKGSLKAKWFERRLHYRFTLVPLPNEEDRFLSVLQKYQAKNLRLYIHLLDNDEFKVCSASPVMHQHLGPNGNADSLEADEVFSSCTEDQFKRALKWSISGNYPAVSQSLEPPKTSESTQSPPSARLTGRDFVTGEVETLDEGSFQVTKKAEYMTLMGWEPADNIKIACVGKSCVLTDLRTQESVHATAK